MRGATGRQGVASREQTSVTAKRDQGIDAVIEFNQAKEITRIIYPGQNKIRTFQRDQNGRLCSVATRDADGCRTYFAEGAQWFVTIEGIKLRLPGEISLDCCGNFYMELAAGGLRRRESPAGVTVEEYVTATGARVALDADGNIAAIERSDGSFVQATRQNGSLTAICHWQPDGRKSITWTMSGNLWLSDRDDLTPCRHIALQANGNTVYDFEDTTRLVIRGNGAELLEYQGSARFCFDSEGRIHSIQYPGGKKLRSFTYAGRTTNLASIIVNNLEKGLIRIYNATDRSDLWSVSDGSGRKLGLWAGQIGLSNEGIYSLKAHRGEHTSSQGLWRSFKSDGSETREATSCDTTHTSPE